MVNVWKRRIPAGWLLACLLSLFLVTSATATIFESVQSQFLIERSGTASSWLTIGRSGTSNSYFTLGRDDGILTPTQSASLGIVVTFGAMAMVLMLIALKDNLTVGTFVMVAISGIIAMIGMVLLSNLLSGI